ncbi:MAG TPA: PIN domain-containing protein [bacterium]|nr:PIN domain-containing protein [bacterium]
MTGDALKCSVITLDTSVFYNHGFALDRGLLKLLEQFKGTPIKFVLSEVVYKELRKHLAEKVGETRTLISKGLEKANEILLIETSNTDIAKAHIWGKGTNENIAEDRLKAFCENTGAEIILFSEVKIDDLLNLYFAAEPPFEAIGKKKNEFPDAIALLSLESWAKKKSLKILAVSADNGWGQFAKKSDAMRVLKDLGEAISYFQPRVRRVRVEALIHLLCDTISSDQENIILQEIANAIKTSVNDSNIEVEASSSLHFETQDVYARYEAHEFVCDVNNDPIITLVKIDDQEFVLRFSIDVKSYVFGDFSLSIWDSVDKEYVTMQDVSLEQQENYQTDVLVSIEGDPAKGIESLTVKSVEVLKSIGRVNFGEIEFDYEDMD